MDTKGKMSTRGAQQSAEMRRRALDKMDEQRRSSNVISTVIDNKRDELRGATTEENEQVAKDNDEVTKNMEAALMRARANTIVQQALALQEAALKTDNDMTKSSLFVPCLIAASHILSAEIIANEMQPDD